MNTARITTTIGEVVTEIIAPRTELIWDPETNKGQVVFHMEKQTKLEGDLMTQIPVGRLTQSFDTLMAREWEYPTDEGTSTISTAQLMHVIKTAFDSLYNEALVPSEEET